MLDKDTDETLNGAEAYAVNHNRTLLAAVLCGVLQVKSLRHLEVKLDGTALPGSSQGVSQVEVNLGAVECAVAFIDDVIHSHVLKGLLQTVCCHLPILVGTHGILRSGGQLYEILEAELAVNLVNQLCYALDFILDLVVSHKDMGIILREAAHTHQSMKLSALFMAVNQSQLANS